MHFGLSTATGNEEPTMILEGKFTHEDAVAARRERDTAVATVALREQRIEELEAALTEIRDLLPIVQDNYSRRVFAVAAEALEPDRK